MDTKSSTEIEEKSVMKNGPPKLFIGLIVLGLLMLGALLGYIHYEAIAHQHTDLCVEVIDHFQPPYFGVYIVRSANKVWRIGDQLVVRDPSAYAFPNGSFLALYDNDYGEWSIDWDDDHQICKEFFDE